MPVPRKSIGSRVCVQPLPYFDSLNQMTVVGNLSEKRYGLPITRSQAKKLLPEQCASPIEMNRNPKPLSTTVNQNSTKYRSDNRRGVRSNKEVKPNSLVTVDVGIKTANKSPVSRKPTNRSKSHNSARSKRASSPCLVRKPTKRSKLDSSTRSKRTGKSSSTQITTKRSKSKSSARNKIASKSSRTMTTRSKSDSGVRSKTVSKSSVARAPTKRNKSEKSTRNRVARKSSSVRTRTTRSKSDRRARSKTPNKLSNRSVTSNKITTPSSTSKRRRPASVAKGMSKMLTVKYRSNNSKTWDEMPVTRSFARRRGCIDDTIDTIETRRTLYILRPPLRSPAKRRPATSKRQSIRRNPSPPQVHQSLPQNEKAPENVEPVVATESVMPSVAAKTSEPFIPRLNPPLHYSTTASSNGKAICLKNESTSASTESICEKTSNAEISFQQSSVDTECRLKQSSWIVRTARAVSGCLRRWSKK